MSLTVAVTAIVAADILLLAVLTFAMSRARLLTPHVPAGAITNAPQPAVLVNSYRPQRRSPRPAKALTANV